MTHVSLFPTYLLRLTVAAAERIKALGLFDVMALPLVVAPLYEMRTRPHKFLSVVVEMLDGPRGEPMTLAQLESQVTDAEAYGQLWEAFTDEVTNFFREPLRPAISLIFETLEKAEAHRVADLTATIQTSLSAIESNSPGGSSGGLPESPESMPDISHCDSLTIWPPADVVTSGTGTLDSVPSPPTVTDQQNSPLSTQTISTHIATHLAG